MSSINSDIFRISSSIPTVKKRNSKAKLFPRSSSVTISKIRKKNILNNSNNDKINNINFSMINYQNKNNSSLGRREIQSKSERMPINIINDFNNNNINEDINNIKKNIFENIDIFIEDDLMEEEIIEENNKIKSVLNDLIFWDNEHLTDRKDKKNTLIASIQKEKTFYYSKNDIEKKLNKTINKKGQKVNLDKKSNILKLKYKILNSNKKSENKVNKFDIENDPKFKENALLINLKKERKKLEIIQREELKQIYKQLIINKIKKKKYNEVLNNTYHLLDKARTEYNLSVDILEKRIEATQKYYEAIIKDYEIQHHFEKKPINKDNLSNSLNNNITSVKKIRTKINNLELYEAKMKNYREYLSIVEDINDEIKKYDNKFNNIQNELNDLLIQINKKLTELNNDNNKLKIIYKELRYKETQYYLSILKTGTDTRADGLSWIIKRLIELNIPMNYSIFPKFLDREEINYLIQISTLEYEKAQIINIIENLKQRKKKNLVINSKIINNKLTDKKDLYQKFKFNINLNDDNNYKNLYGSKLFDKVIEKYNNHYITKNKLYAFKKQNSADNLILEDIKKKLNIFAHNKDSNIFKKENNKEFSNINQKDKEQYYNILFLSEREKKLNLYIQKMRMKEYLKFKEKFKAIQIKDLLYKQYYNQVFNALFGKNNFDISPSKSIKI